MDTGHRNIGKALTQSNPSGLFIISSIAIDVGSTIPLRSRSADCLLASFACVSPGKNTLGWLFSKARRPVSSAKCY